MIVLDENVVDTQCHLLRKWRIRFRQIGFDIGRQGMTDNEIISLIPSLSQPTFFTRDDDFFGRHLTHARDCLTHMAIRKNEVAVFARRVVRNPRFNTRAKRMGKVIRVAHGGFLVWRLHAEVMESLQWLN